MNLLKETITILNENNKSPDDVVWVGSIKFGSFSWEAFTKLADREYYDGHSSVEVATDLLVVGKDFWLERHEYDGAEWWEFKTMPIQPQPVLNVKNLFSEYGYDLSKINEVVLV
jgi:hypothetical protein